MPPGPRPPKYSPFANPLTATYDTNTSSLVLSLRNLKAAFYDDDTEATCRIAVDYMIVAAKLCINELHPPPARFKKRRVQTPATATLLTAPSQEPAPLPIRVFPELELDVIVTTTTDTCTTPTETRVTGRADWALGYGSRADALSGAVLVAVEAKRLETFSQAESQLLTYLAILRQLRIHAGKINPVVQGFYTDGTQYKFLGITNDGEVFTSRTYDTRDPDDMKTVFNFIVTIMLTASRSTPNVSPEKGLQRQASLERFHKTVWVKVYNAEEKDGLEILGEDDGGVLQELEDAFQ